MTRTRFVTALLVAVAIVTGPRLIYAHHAFSAVFDQS